MSTQAIDNQMKTLSKEEVRMKRVASERIPSSAKPRVVVTDREGRVEAVLTPREYKLQKTRHQLANKRVHHIAYGEKQGRQRRKIANENLQRIRAYKTKLKQAKAEYLARRQKYDKYKSNKRAYDWVIRRTRAGLPLDWKTAPAGAYGYAQRSGFTSISGKALPQFALVKPTAPAVPKNFNKTIAGNFKMSSAQGGFKMSVAQFRKEFSAPIVASNFSSNPFGYTKRRKRK